MRTSTLVSLAGAAAVAQDTPVPAAYYKGFSNVSTFNSVGGKATCVQGITPVHATTSKNMKLNFGLPANQTAVTEAIVESLTIGMPLMKAAMGPMTTVSGTYDISAMLCYPSGQSINDTTVQILSHGIGFAKSYWNFASLDYSYVDAAAEAGYATFAYDRLGVGASAHPDPIQVVQAPLELEILNTLAMGLKSGTFASTSFKHVIGVGHSFGSVLTQGVSAAHPTTFDAVVLTGFSTSMTGMPPFMAALDLTIARNSVPAEFMGLNNGYLVANNMIGNQFAFFKQQGLPYANQQLAEAAKNTVTFGELMTTTAVVAPAKNFTGPVDVVNGDSDFPFCQGNCRMPMNQAAAVRVALYPKADKEGSRYFLAPVSGHGLNAHYSAQAAYAQIMDFAKANGL